MEFVETPTFWCPHVDRAACTNFRPRTVELRPSESREIFPFTFLLSPFPSFSLYEPFSFFFFLSSFPLFPFCFSILFLFSHLISLSFSLLICHFFSLLGAHHSFGQRRKFPPLFLKSIVWLSIFHPYFLISLFPFMTSSPTWLNVSHGIHFPHMANCDPFFQCQVSLSWGAKWHP